jgi:hypothetical protein
MGWAFMVRLSLGAGNENAYFPERSFILIENPVIGFYHIRMVNYSLCVKRLFGTFIFRDNGLHKTSKLIEPGNYIYNYLTRISSDLLFF